MGKLYYGIGQYEKSLQEFREVIRFEPEDTASYRYTTTILVYLNRFSEVRNELEEARAKEWRPLDLHLVSYRLAFLQDDAAGMSREIAWAADTPFAGWFLNLDAETASYFGKFGKSRELSRRAMQSSKQNGDSEGAWRVVAERILREVLVGNIEEGRRAGAAFEDYASSRQKELALALAFAGETTKPRSFAEETEKKEFRATRDLLLTAIQAQVRLNEKNSAKAVELLASIEPYKLVNRPVAYAIFIRAYANLAAPHIDAAKADFQEILDHRGTVGNSLVGALAHVGLARACVVQGDTAGAKRAYEVFLTLWKDADPDIPILKEAKAEYAKLK